MSTNSRMFLALATLCLLLASQDAEAGAGVGAGAGAGPGSNAWLEAGAGTGSETGAGAKAGALGGPGAMSGAGSGVQSGTIRQKLESNLKEMRGHRAGPQLSRRVLQEEQGSAQLGMVQKFQSEFQKEISAPGAEPVGASGGGGGEGGGGGGLVATEVDAESLSVEALRETVERQRKAIAGLMEEVQELRKVNAALRSPGALDYPAMPPEVYRLEEDYPKIWQQRTFRRHGAYGFISYSAYRLSPTLFTVIGLGRLHLERTLGPCSWVYRDGREIPGNATVHYAPDHMDKMYELVVLECELLTPPSDQDSQAQGDLFVSSQLGHLKVSLDQEIFYPYREDNGYKIHSVHSKGPFQHQLLYCSPPMYGSHSVEAVTQWMVYHRAYAGFDHFIFYDAGSVVGPLREELQPLVEEGVVTLTDFREALKYESMMQGQLVAMQDCLHRSRDIARWVLFMDFDEYLVVKAVPGTLKPLLEAYAESASVSHGMFQYDVDLCSVENPWDPSHGQMAVEHIVMRDPTPFCTLDVPGSDHKLCEGSMGHRKMIYNPRKVLQILVHTVQRPLDRTDGTSTDSIYHAHYRGLQVAYRACNATGSAKSTDKKSKFHEWKWKQYNIQKERAEKETSVARIAAKARECAATNFKHQEKCNFTSLVS